MSDLTRASDVLRCSPSMTATTTDLSDNRRKLVLPDETRALHTT